MKFCNYHVLNLQWFSDSHETNMERKSKSSFKVNNRAIFRGLTVFPCFDD